MCFFLLPECVPVLSQTRRWKSLSGIFTVRSPNLLWSVNVCRCTIGTEGGGRSASLQEDPLVGWPQARERMVGGSQGRLGCCRGQMGKTGWLWGQGRSSRLFSH